MIIHEKERSVTDSYLYHQKDTNLSFGLHMHNSFEFIYCADGEIQLTIDNVRFTLRNGHAALILPNQIHAYCTETASKSYLCVFSVMYLGDYANRIKDKIAINPLFLFDKHLPLLEIMQNETSNEYELKACFYFILGAFTKTTTYAERDKKAHTLLDKVIDYISNNYTNSISLTTLARTLGYDYHYLSGILHKTLNSNFLQLVNEYRILFAKQLLLTTDKTATEIAHHCGYDSVRSFNRNFYKLTATTPSDYRNKV